MAVKYEFSDQKEEPKPIRIHPLVIGFGLLVVLVALASAVASVM